MENKLRTIRSKKAAMEMSVGTIVTIVLLVTVLVLGLVLIRSIFTSGVRSVNQIDDKVRSAIDDLFIKDESVKIAFSPSDRKVKIEQGAVSEGFAFSVRNIEKESRKFRYTIAVDSNFDIRKQCNININEAESWLVINSGSFELDRNSKPANPELVLFNIPENAPSCTLPYVVRVTSDGEFYIEGKVFVTILQK